jgi:hypothetical protein
MKALGKGSVASIIGMLLQCAWILLWIAAAGLAILVVAYAGVLVMCASGVIDPEILSGGKGEIQFGGLSGRYATDYDSPGDLTWPYIAPAILAGAVAIGGGLIIVSRLKRLFRNFASDEPFSADNAGHLRAIWIALLIVEISRYAIAALMKVLLLAIGPPANVAVTISPPFSFISWAAILVLIVLAEVFREGARMREDQKLTI